MIRVEGMSCCHLLVFVQNASAHFQTNCSFFLGTGMVSTHRLLELFQKGSSYYLLYVKRGQEGNSNHVAMAPNVLAFIPRVSYVN